MAQSAGTTALSWGAKSKVSFETWSITAGLRRHRRHSIRQSSRRQRMRSLTAFCRTSTAYLARSFGSASRATNLSVKRPCSAACCPVSELRFRASWRPWYSIGAMPVICEGRATCRARARVAMPSRMRVWSSYASISDSAVGIACPHKKASSTTSSASRHAHTTARLQPRTLAAGVDQSRSVSFASSSSSSRVRSATFGISDRSFAMRSSFLTPPLAKEEEEDTSA
mmetsp:Transcript_3670/g.12061  ORF Transcript_3670/g.12061 Transcript_3670/m.12061 type:complete len:226 (+) Transcript_3670:634-1311(+)